MPTLCIGFTGTRDGLTYEQRERLIKFMKDKGYFARRNIIFIHGGCVGADERFHSIVMDYKKDDAKVFVRYGHASDGTGYYQMPGDRDPSVTNFASKPYLWRNRDIVADCDLLIACPGEEQEKQRSGTWSTIRLAAHQHKPFCIVTPHGVTRNYI